MVELSDKVEGNPKIPKDLPEQIFKGIPVFLASSAKGTHVYYAQLSDGIHSLKIGTDKYRLRFSNYGYNPKLLKLYIDNIRLSEQEVKRRLTHLLNSGPAFPVTGTDGLINGNRQNYELMSIDFNGESTEITLQLKRVPESPSKDFYIHILRYLIPEVKAKVHKALPKINPSQVLRGVRPRLPLSED